MPVRWRTERAIRDSRGDHELVPGPEVIEAGIPFGAAGQAPGSDIGPDPLAPGIGPAGRAGAAGGRAGRDPGSHQPLPGAGRQMATPTTRS